MPQRYDLRGRHFCHRFGASWFKIFNSATGEFVTEGDVETAGNWVSADSLEQMQIPTDSSKFQVRAYEPDNGLTDYEDVGVTVVDGSYSSTWSLATETEKRDRLIIEIKLVI